MNNDTKFYDNEYILNTYKRFPVTLIAGKGAEVLSDEGKKYLDFSSGIAVNTFGYCDKEWVDAVTYQAERLQHTSNLYYTVPQVELAKLLCTKTGAKKVFFSNSGAEANECAIKAARKYSFDKYGQDRHQIITLKNSFHGRTMATLTATGQDSMHTFFNPFLQGFKYAEPENFAQLKELCKNNTCAVMLELIQGESGVTVLSKEYVGQVARFCKQNDILLIIDEVQTGNGRTGSLFLYNKYSIMPDIVTTAKGLAGGLPLGATLFFDKTSGVLAAGQHGSTFGANPVCCAAALSVLKRLNNELLLEVQGKGDYLKTHIGRMRKVSAISGEGLMLGIELKDITAQDAALACLEKGLLVITAKEKLRLLPPLNITKTELDKGIEILSEVLDNETSS